jgi:hypothetical protein
MSEKYGGGCKYSSGSSGSGGGGKKPNDNKKPDYTSGSSGSGQSQDKELQKKIDKFKKLLPDASERYQRNISNQISKILKEREKENKK